MQPIVFVWSQKASIRPRHISPGDRTARLAREGRRLTEASRHDQLRHAVKSLYTAEILSAPSADRDTRLEALESALDVADDYSSLRDAVKEYKMIARRDDPN